MVTSLGYIKDKQLIGKIQRRFVKMIPGFRDKSYEEGLRILRLNTLKERRNRADLIFLFKMYKGLTRPPFDSLFQLTTKHDRTRGHTLKLTKHCSNRCPAVFLLWRLKGWSITGISWTNLSLRLPAWRHSNGVYVCSEVTRWTYLRINIRTRSHRPDPESSPVTAVPGIGL